MCHAPGLSAVLSLDLPVMAISMTTHVATTWPPWHASSLDPTGYWCPWPSRHLVTNAASHPTVVHPQHIVSANLALEAPKTRLNAVDHAQKTCRTTRQGLGVVAISPYASSPHTHGVRTYIPGETWHLRNVAMVTSLAAGGMDLASECAADRCGEQCRCYSRGILVLSEDLTCKPMPACTFQGKVRPQN